MASYATSDAWKNAMDRLYVLASGAFTNPDLLDRANFEKKVLEMHIAKYGPECTLKGFLSGWIKQTSAGNNGDRCLAFYHGDFDVITSWRSIDYRFVVDLMKEHCSRHWFTWDMDVKQEDYSDYPEITLNGKEIKLNNLRDVVDFFFPGLWHEISPGKRQRIEVRTNETLTCDSITKIFGRVGEVESVESIGKGTFSVVMFNGGDRCIKIFNGLNLDDKNEETHFTSRLVPL